MAHVFNVRIARCCCHVENVTHVGKSSEDPQGRTYNCGMPLTLALSRTLRDVLLRSGLLSQEQWASVRCSVSDDDPSSDQHALQQLVEQGWLTPFHAERLLEGRSRGFFFDEYKIVDVLGLGGMGWVYQATRNHPGEFVALKVLRDDLQHDQGMLARFQHEAAVGMRMNHPNVVGTRSAGFAGGLPYMIMDLVPGPSLSELLQGSKRLPCEAACEFTRQAALGLEHVHQRNVVHRDVKPQNLLIDRTGCVKLADFGLSMIQAGEAGDEFSFARIFGQESVGTLDYAAPEQLDDSLHADARSDIYALGGVLFMLLTGYTPGEVQELPREPNQPFRSVRDFVPDIPGEVADIVAKMVHETPGRRFASSETVAEALSKWAKHATVDFDFRVILDERKKKAQERMALLSHSRSASSRLTPSTARPGAAPHAVIAKTSPKKGEKPAGELSPKISPHAAPVQAEEVVCKGELRRTKDHLRRSRFLLRFLNTDCRVGLQGERVLIGRSQDCDLQLSDHAVSGRHCELRLEGARWRIVDLGSQNGVHVNGIAVKTQMLRPGDEVLLGNHQRFRFESTSPIRQQSSTRRRLAIAVLALLAAIVAVLLAALVLRP